MPRRRPPHQHKAGTYDKDPEKSAAALVAAAADSAAAAGVTVSDVKKAADTQAAAESGNQAALDTAAAAAGADAAAAAAAAADKAASYTTDPDKAAAKRVADAAVTASQGGATPADVLEAAEAAARTAAPLDKAVLDIGMKLEAASAGSWGNGLRARVDYDVIGPDAANMFNLSVRDDSTGVVEVFRNVSVVPGYVRQVDKVLANESALVRAQGSLPGSRPPESANLADGQSDVWDDNDRRPTRRSAMSAKPPTGVAHGRRFHRHGQAECQDGPVRPAQGRPVQPALHPAVLASDDVDRTPW